MKRTALLLILLFCTSGEALAQSIWDEPVESSSAPQKHANIWDSNETVTTKVRPSRPKRRPIAHRAPIVKASPQPVLHAAIRTPAPKVQPALKAQPTPPARPAPQASPRPSTTQATIGTSDIPLNLRSGNLSTFFPSRSLGKEQEPCTDVLACIARAYPPSAAEQARTLAQFAKIEAMMSPPPMPIIHRNSATSASPLAYANYLSRFFSVGRRAASRIPQCAKAVRMILQSAGLITSEGHPNSAKDYIPFLQRNGFRNNPNSCQTPGVVRVYGAAKKGARYYGRRRTSGDIHGHVEILGLDHKFHHFTSSVESIDQKFGSDRRPLLGCMVKENWSSR